jgi:hypothetical protein
MRGMTFLKTVGPNAAFLTYILVFACTCLCIGWLIFLIFLIFKHEVKGPKGEKLTDEVIQAYKEQDDWDKESVFDQTK